MLNLLPVSRVLAGVAVAYGIIVALILWVTVDTSTTLWDSVGIALAWSTGINLVFITVFFVAWKWVWKLFPILNRILFPNLEGDWNIEIHWRGGGESGIVKGTAHIVQNFLKISMEVNADRSESETLCAVPSKDPASGRPILYYVYRVIPKQIESTKEVEEVEEAEEKKAKNYNPYDGTAILKVDHGSHDVLNGNYFTSVDRKGFYILSK